MSWPPWRRRRPDPEPEPDVTRQPAAVAARRAVVESRRALATTRQDVDRYTGEIRKLLGGAP